MADDAPASVPAMPLVSVLIPAFNHERFVQRCLDSVLEDPYPAKELIIIDDGSTDSTGERIAEWVVQHSGELPIEYVRRNNRGIAATLNELAADRYPKATDTFHKFVSTLWSNGLSRRMASIPREVLGIKIGG